MNMDEILTLVQAVSDSKLTSFKLDQGDMHISLKKEKEEAKPPGWTRPLLKEGA